MQFPDFKHELACLKEGYEFVAGCDEVGRGPLAGPVVAAACVLDPKKVKGKREEGWYERVRDSKSVSEKERAELLPKILDNALAHGVGIVWQVEIDQINIHNAGLLAMRKAVSNLERKFKSKNLLVFVDGRFEIPNIAYKQKAIVKGDSSILSIAAASIIAKVHRDNIMRELDRKFPEYGFAKHKGYGTKEHQQALKKFGASVVHRRTFIKI